VFESLGTSIDLSEMRVVGRVAVLDGSWCPTQWWERRHNLL